MAHRLSPEAEAELDEILALPDRLVLKGVEMEWKN
jgi:hypothetical protein